MTGCSIRTYRPSDSKAVVDLINRCHEEDQIGFRISADSFQAISGEGHVDPESHYFLAVVRAQLAGFSMLSRELGTRTILHMWVHPEFRGSEIGQRMVLHSARQASLFPEPLLDIPVKSTEKNKLGLMQHLGYHYERTWWRMRVELRSPVPKAVLPPEFTTRTFVVERDGRALSDLVNAAFSEHWGEGMYTMEELEHDLSLPWFDPKLLVLAETEGQMVGYVWSWINPDTIALTGDARGTISDLGIIAAYRRRGLGRALLLRALADLQTRGMTAAELDMDGPNANAKRLYESVGFREKEETRWFRKELRRE